MLSYNSGHPDPTVTWTHNGGPVSDSAEAKRKLNKATLILPNVTQTQGGQYTCAIENDAGMAQCTCDVIIKSEYLLLKAVLLYFRYYVYNYKSDMPVHREFFIFLITWTTN